MDSAKLIIVGAGASGLAAAYHLRRQGHRPVILEAGRRIGGRIYTHRRDGSLLPVELGAEFVHGEPEVTLGLVRAAGLPHTEWSGKFMVSEKGKIHESQELWNDVEKLMTKLKPPVGGDISWGDAAKKLPRKWARAIELSSYFIQGFHGANPNEISLRTLKMMDDSEQAETSFRILSGYDSLLNLLQSPEQEIRFGHRVRKIEWKRGKVVLEVEADGEPKRLECERLLLTVPISILASDIVFDPVIPEKQKALSLMVMGHVAKVTVEFAETFWDPKMSLLTAPGVFFPTWWTTEPVRSRRLVAWTGHDRALELADKSDAEVMDLVLSSAAKIFKRGKKQLVKDLISADYHNWTRDPFTRGAYSYRKTGGIDAPKLLARPVEDTLFFAGEACYPGGSEATVDGALETGVWAAKKIHRTHS